MTKRIFFLMLLSLLPAVALAAGPTYDLISPIGGMSTGVDMKTYLANTIKITIGIAGVLAVVMLVICGIKMMMSGAVSGKSEAKECVWNAIFGLLIAVAAWALLYTINPELLKNDLTLANVPVAAPLPSAPRVDPNPTAPGCYFKYKYLPTGDIAFLRSDSCETCEQFLVGFQADPKYSIQSSCYEVAAGVPTAPTAAGAPPPATTGVTCTQSGRNLCEPQFRECDAPGCGVFSGIAAKYGSGAVSANLIKAIILQESTCGQGLVGDGGVSCGPMQTSVSNANKYLGKCGLTIPVTCGWLGDKANWDKAVCLSTEYLKAVSLTSCGTDTRNIAAGYNSGPGRCAPSSDCGGDISCDGTAVKQWECLYDDAAHTTCNGGLISTRNYATKVLYCTLNPGF